MLALSADCVVAPYARSVPHFATGHGVGNAKQHTLAQYRTSRRKRVAAHASSVPDIAQHLVAAYARSVPARRLVGPNWLARSIARSVPDTA
eukprot:228846-Rhodomonas_salina.1